jgi:succinate dehydrogenase / fumarate reductase membrane anchor subunit
VLGSGSAKDGTEHWWMQRVTAVALLILGPWFLLSLAGLERFEHVDLVAWVGRPNNAIMLLLAGLTLAWHSALGVQVIIEDYVHGPALKVVSLILSRFVHVLLAASAVLAVLKVALGSNS